MMKKCIGCGVELQMEDIKKPGYIKDINQDYCQRCFRMTHYNDLTIDMKNRIERKAILDKIRSERLEEELRLFYVALTRTQDKLVMIGTVSDIEKKSNELKTMLISSDGIISNDLFSKTKTLEILVLIKIIYF